MGTRVGTRDLIVEAAVAVVSDVGWERTTVSAVARRADVSRPTVYAYFPNREDLHVEVALRVAERFTRRVATSLPRVRSGADFVVEIVSAWLAAYRADLALSSLGVLGAPDTTFSPETFVMVREFLTPLVDFAPHLEAELDDVVETIMRFLLSLMEFPSANTASEAALRSYIRRRLVPALGL
jgi:AcrR family transcriptional regulator